MPRGACLGVDPVAGLWLLDLQALSARMFDKCIGVIDPKYDRHKALAMRRNMGFHHLTRPALAIRSEQLKIGIV